MAKSDRDLTRSQLLFQQPIDPIRDNLITLFDRCVTFVHSLFSKANSPLLGGDAQIFWWLRAASHPLYEESD